MNTRILTYTVIMMMSLGGAFASNKEEDSGMLRTPQKGASILVWDARTNGNERLIRRFLKTNDPIRMGAPGLAVTTLRESFSGDAFKAASKKFESPDVAMVVMLVNAGSENPRLSVFPEDRIGLINADRFSSILLDKLLLREIWRTIGFTGGTGYAPYRGCVMQPAFNDNEIAGLMGDVLQPMTLQPFRKFETRFNMKRSRMVPYELACEQGWAPAPTNAAQKAVWDRVRAIPKNPMKIEFDPKKGR